MKQAGVTVAIGLLANGQPSPRRMRRSRRVIVVALGKLPG